jgi:NADH dehydrogenase [ubiquinone] 1 alpha subcomplex assembly factor 5
MNSLLRSMPLGTRRVMQDGDIFSRAARRQHHVRATRSRPDDRWIMNRISEELLARLDAVRRPVRTALVLGNPAEELIETLQARGISPVLAGLGGARRQIVCEEDRLPFADCSMDLVLCVGGLDTVNDLPGALVLVRRVLNPDGVFLGAMIAGGSLSTLRKALAEAETGAVARIHPQVDVRAAGDLLARAGFVLPVADIDEITARYATLSALVRDLRANGLTSSLAKRHPMTASQYAATDRALPRDRDGRFSECFAVAYLTGWAPSR